jgi:2,4-dichlorophenol 6-monooxygenase
MAVSERLERLISHTRRNHWHMGEEGAPWCKAAEELASTGVPLGAVRIGHIDGDLYHPRCMWARNRGIRPEGAILVRPDRFVAWRNPEASEAPLEELREAFARVLAKPTAVAAAA